MSTQQLAIHWYRFLNRWSPWPLRKRVEYGTHEIGRLIHELTIAHARIKELEWKQAMSNYGETFGQKVNTDPLRIRRGGKTWVL